MPVIVFDLDDTLYEEITFVRSGFRAVSRYLKDVYGINEDHSYHLMLEALELSGRGQVFDSVLSKFGVLSKKEISRCLSVYRTHTPTIQLYPDAATCLQSLGGQPMYIVTDGNKHVQQRKLEALGLYEHEQIRRCFISRRFGIHNEKPSPHCFEIIRRIEKVSPEQVYYIGDNPNKDFVGIKPLGYRTVRVRRGNFSALSLTDEFEADKTILTLMELPQLIRETE